MKGLDADGLFSRRAQVLVFATGNVSGAHFNPAVTLGVLASQPGRASSAGSIKTADALIYICVHLLASVLAGFMCYWVLGPQIQGKMRGSPTLFNFHFGAAAAWNLSSGKRSRLSMFTSFWDQDQISYCVI